MTPVIVHWNDAHADSAGSWVEPHNVDQRPYLVRSVGWLVAEDAGGKPGHMTIAQSIGAFDADDVEALDHVLHIPVGMVCLVRSVM